MSDFLHNLRNGNVGNRYDRSRKNYDNPQYRSADRHSGRDKRGGAQRKPHPSEQMTLIKKILEEIQESQRELVRAARERTAAEKRMADALEAIAGHFSGSRLAVAPIPDPPEPVEKETSPSAEAVPAQSDPASTAAEAFDDSEPTDENARHRRGAALNLIQELRSKGMAYEKIARHLESNNVPTVSGRGRWRGQAVSKLLAEA